MMITIIISAETLRAKGAWDIFGTASISPRKRSFDQFGHVERQLLFILLLSRRMICLTAAYPPFSGAAVVGRYCSCLFQQQTTAANCSDGYSRRRWWWWWWSVMVTVFSSVGRCFSSAASRRDGRLSVCLLVLRRRIVPGARCTDGRAVFVLVH